MEITITLPDTNFYSEQKYIYFKDNIWKEEDITNVVVKMRSYIKPMSFQKQIFDQINK